MATCVACTGSVLCQAAVVAFMQPVAQNGERARKKTPSDGALGPRSHWLSRRHAAERQQEPRGLKGGRMSTQRGGCHRRGVAKARPSEDQCGPGNDGLRSAYSDRGCWRPWSGLLGKSPVMYIHALLLMPNPISGQNHCLLQAKDCAISPDPRGCTERWKTSALCYREEDREVE